MLAQVGHDVGLLCIRDDKLIVDNHLHETRLIRKLIEGSLQLIRKVILQCTNDLISGNSRQDDIVHEPFVSGSRQDASGKSLP